MKHLSGYKIKWTLGIFDNRGEDPKEWKKFRSIFETIYGIKINNYNRTTFFPTNEEKETSMKALIPKNCEVKFIRITDKQFGMMEIYIK